MSENSNYLVNSGANSATQPVEPVNDASKSLNRNYNKFPNSYKFMNTLRYGEISPFFVFEGVEGDKLPFSSKHEIRSYTLKSPMMSDIRMNKDYFLVPLQALLPNTWHLIYTNPTQGDDVPEDANMVVDANTMENYFYTFIQSIESALQAYKAGVTTPKITAILRGCALLDVMYSNGSLLSTLGCKFGKLFTSTDSDGRRISLDKWLQTWYTKLVNNTISVKWPDDSQTYVVDSKKRTSNAFTLVSRHSLIERMRENPIFDVVECTPLSEDVAKTPETLVMFNPKGAKQCVSVPFNYSRLAAYQLTCAHYYTNDKVDFLFTAELWRNNMMALANNARIADGQNANWEIRWFEYNGTPIMYDALSGYYMKNILGLDSHLWDSNLTASQIENSNTGSGIHYLVNVFGYQRSLRFGDYFTGSRPHPIAVGDVNAPVIDGKVSAIDMTRNIMMQRFLNSVNRVGRKFSDYISKVMGGAPAPDQHEPQFLSHSVSMVGGFEVENTAQNQGNITTLLRASNDDYEFSVDIEQPCIVLGLVSFDIARVYSQVTSKFFFKKDRFDMFNPYMQYIGDQPIERAELGLRYYESDEIPFSFTLRHMEYKQGVNYCSGGFVEDLPAWAFIPDNNSSGCEEIPHTNIDPEFIRSRASEMDRFYESLTGDTLGNYFHFIVKFDNSCDCVRAMDFAPSIL